MPKNAQNGLWIGDINIGMTLRLKDPTWHRPLVNVYYKYHPLQNPTWANNGLGTWTVTRNQHTIESKASTGPHTLQPGKPLTYIAEFFITPYHTLDTDAQWKNRYYQNSGGRDPAEMDNFIDTYINPTQHRANIYNAHHAGYVAPYINYPYSDDNIDALKDFVRKVHAKNALARIYYTTRELSVNIPEIHALHALQGEIIQPNHGKQLRGELNKTTPKFLEQNLGEEFIAAWTARIPKNYSDGTDPSVLTVPDGRLDNFYLGGLEWMIKNIGIDGCYIDDTALNARSFQRARRIMTDNARKGPLLDFHSWHSNHAWGSFLPNLVHYADILPYIDHMWMGEGYNANKMTPDTWLVLASGIPFGLMSEMLDGPNFWKGLIFGEVARRDPAKSSAMWKTYDTYGMEGTEMLLFTDPQNPVKTGHDKILASVFKKQGRTFVAIASWDTQPATITPHIDWPALGLDPAKATLYAPPIKDIQEETIYKPGAPLNLQPGRGLFLILDEQPREIAPPPPPDSQTAQPRPMQTLFTDDFDNPVLPQEWIIRDQPPQATITHTASNAKITINAPANTYCGLFRALPSGVQTAQATFDIETDKGQSWGTGIALIWENGKTAHLHLRARDRKIGAFSSGSKLEKCDGYNPRENTLRIELRPDEILFQHQANGTWTTLATHPRGKDLQGDPQELRIGKMDLQGNWTNHTQPGPPGQSTVRQILVQGI